MMQGIRANYFAALGLKRQHQGGYVKQFYHSPEKVEDASKAQPAVSTGSYLFLDFNHHLTWQKLPSDVILHCYQASSPVYVHVIDEKGEYKKIMLGNPSVVDGAIFIATIPANSYFAVEVSVQNQFAFLGTTVFPGFEEVDLKLPEREKFQKHSEIIQRLSSRKEKNDIDFSAYQLLAAQTERTAEQYIQLLNLEKHIEGPWFSLVYKSKQSVMPLEPRYAKKFTEETESKRAAEAPIQRNAGSLIYFLIEKDIFSEFHILKSDETWHYYDGGSPIYLHVIDEKGDYNQYILGNPAVTEDASFTLTIKAGWWFAAEVADQNSFALAGCSVAPAFEYEDFILADREELIKQFPQHRELVIRFTREDLNKKKEDGKEKSQAEILVAQGVFSGNARTENREREAKRKPTDQAHAPKLRSFKSDC